MKEGGNDYLVLTLEGGDMTFLSLSFVERKVRKTGKTFPALLAAARVHDVYEEKGSSV